MRWSIFILRRSWIWTNLIWWRWMSIVCWWLNWRKSWRMLFLWAIFVRILFIILIMKISRSSIVIVWGGIRRSMWIKSTTWLCPTSPRTTLFGTVLLIRRYFWLCLLSRKVIFLMKCILQWQSPCRWLELIKLFLTKITCRNSRKRVAVSQSILTFFPIFSRETNLTLTNWSWLERS